MGKLNFLRRFSLLKQLVIVFTALAVVTVFVLMPFIDYTMTSIVDEEAYRSIENFQDSYSSFEQSVTDNDSDSDSDDPATDDDDDDSDKKRDLIEDEEAFHSKHWLHIIYDNTTDTLQFAHNYITEYSVYQFYNSLVSDVVSDVVSDADHTAVKGKGTMSGQTYYYRVSKLELSSTSDDIYLITIMTSSSSDTLLSSFRNRVVYIFYAFLVLVFLVMMFWVLSLISPLRRIKAYLDDIKAHKEAELVMDRNDEIGTVATAMVEMKNDIEKQSKAKEEMIHNISHDLKTPIALIKTYGESVKDDIYPYGTKEASMDIIIENADRLEHKVQDLLYLNRLDYVASEEKELTPFEMKPLIEHIAAQMDALNDLTIETDLEDVTFIGNPDHWRVAIENIVDNASRYAKSLIRITLKKDLLVIYNDGEQIETDKIDDLFDPYVKGVKGKFGLGLSIVAKTAEMYGYDVRARNEQTGVSFVFTKKNPMTSGA